jgi:Ca2+-binding EF-hand superfamily protein
MDLSTEELHEVVKKNDPDGSGEIDKGEFCNMMANLVPREPHPRPQSLTPTPTSEQEA